MNLEELVIEIQSTPRYRDIDISLVRRIASQEAAKGRSFKETVKVARSRLHQVGAAYQPGGLSLERWQGELAGLPRDAADARLRAWCLSAMSQHASTRERLPILDQFFARSLAEIAPIRSVLDLACGLNPLARSWMPLAPEAVFAGCEIYPGLVAFLNQFLEHIAQDGGIQVADLLEWKPPGKVFHLGLVLKTLPCLEQIEKGISLTLLDAIPAEYLLVSFPARSLGGRSKGMARNYEARFRELVTCRAWPMQRFEFSSELAFLIHKGQS